MRFVFILNAIFLLLAGVSARAEEIVFRRQNTLGLIRVDKLEHTEKIYKFNGKTLAGIPEDQLAVAYSDFIKAVETPHKSSACASGSYTYLKKQMGEHTQFEGCTEGPIYREISQRLDKIRKWSLPLAKPVAEVTP